MRASTVLDTENLHFPEEFFNFLVQAETDICADALGFSARFRSNFLHDFARIFRTILCGRIWAGIPRRFVQKVVKASHVRMFSRL